MASKDAVPSSVLVNSRHLFAGPPGNIRFFPAPSLQVYGLALTRYNHTGMFAFINNRILMTDTRQL